MRIEKIIKKYLSKVGLKSLEEIDDQNSFWIIKSAYKDFKEKKLSFEDFSTLGGFLFNNLKSTMAKSLEFGLLLLEIAELSDEIKIGNNTEESLINIDKYFENH